MTSAEFIYTVLLRPRPLRALANRVLRLIIPRELHIHGCRVALNPDDPVVSGALTLGVYERPETRFFRFACRPGMTFLDVGANVGYYTALAMRNLQEHGIIVALDPDPESFGYLQETVAVNGAGSVICVPKAAAARSGEATLFVSASNRGDNRLYAHDYSSASFPVPVVTIDELLAELDVPPPNLVKIDVQGFEGYVLAGMERSIAASPSVIILMEFWPLGLRSAGFEPRQIFSFCERLGLRVFQLTRSGKIRPLRDPEALIRAFPDRRYTNLVAAKGADFLDEWTVSGKL